MKPFPVTTIYGGDNAAEFYLDGHRVVVPAKLGSRDNREHVIRWLHHCWPFYVLSRVNRRPMLVKKVDGENVLLHKVYARLLGHDGVVEPTDGDLLHWSIENIAPRRKPEKIVPQASQDSEVERQMWRVKHEHGDYLSSKDGSLGLTPLQFYVRQHARLLGDLENIVLTHEQLIALKTKSVLEARQWERELAARRTRADADAARQEVKEDKFFPNYEDKRPEHGTKLIATRAVTSDSYDSANDDADNFVALVPDARIQNSTLEDFRARLNPERHAPGTEAVLNRHGWFSPENGHRPVYEGRVR